jgi:hypothetical protein
MNQILCHMANVYCAMCHDLRPSKMDNVDFSKIKQK